ncbi:LytR/AlgR family response regulator transcription factor [Muriicola soli]|uniref:Response regulator transcription factor n=1 Tax=Muriicola soli TaxID=2507538 RepID=A0A411EAC2_9FLAO|nr:response regulator [Muriicola soli]QBA64493.1 response regulator transcription factor [Muriicola soli]
MNKKTRILIVEDDMIIAANISLQLTKAGYEVTGIESRGEEAVIHSRLNPPDIILMDINLKGRLNGIESVKRIQEVIDIPVIYITANNDEATFEEAKHTHPFAFIAKPITMSNVLRSLALAEEQFKTREESVPVEENYIALLNDRIFIRHHGQMVKLLLQDILYIEADRNYCHVMTSKKEYVLTTTLKEMQNKLPEEIFVRVHRSFLVNISKLDVVAEAHVEINRKAIPLSKSNREGLLKHLQTI